MRAHLVLFSVLLGVSTALECFDGMKLSKGTEPSTSEKCAVGASQCYKQFNTGIAKKNTYSYGCDVGGTVCGTLVDSCDKKNPTKCCCSADLCNLNPEETLPHTPPPTTPPPTSSTKSDDDKNGQTSSTGHSTTPGQTTSAQKTTVSSTSVSTTGRTTVQTTPQPTSTHAKTTVFSTPSQTTTAQKTTVSSTTVSTGTTTVQKTTVSNTPPATTTAQRTTMTSPPSTTGPTTMAVKTTVPSTVFSTKAAQQTASTTQTTMSTLPTTTVSSTPTSTGTVQKTTVSSTTAPTSVKTTGPTTTGQKTTVSSTSASTSIGTSTASRITVSSTPLPTTVGTTTSGQLGSLECFMDKKLSSNKVPKTSGRCPVGVTECYRQAVKKAIGFGYNYGCDTTNTCAPYSTGLGNCNADNSLCCCNSVDCNAGFPVFVPTTTSVKTTVTTSAGTTVTSTPAPTSVKTTGPTTTGQRTTVTRTPAPTSVKTTGPTTTRQRTTVTRTPASTTTEAKTAVTVTSTYASTTMTNSSKSTTAYEEPGVHNCFADQGISSTKSPSKKRECPLGTSNCYRTVSPKLIGSGFNYNYGCDTTSPSICQAGVTCSPDNSVCCCASDDCNDKFPAYQPTSTVPTTTVTTTTHRTRLQCFTDQKLTSEQAPHKLRLCPTATTSCLRQIKPSWLEGGMNYDYSCDSQDICGALSLRGCNADNSICCCGQSGCNNLDLPKYVYPTQTVPKTYPTTPKPIYHITSTTTLSTTIPTTTVTVSTLSSSPTTRSSTEMTRPSSRAVFFSVTVLTFVYGMF